VINQEKGTLDILNTEMPAEVDSPSALLKFCGILNEIFAKVAMTRNQRGHVQNKEFLFIKKRSNLIHYYSFS